MMRKGNDRKQASAAARRRRRTSQESHTGDAPPQRGLAEEQIAYSSLSLHQLFESQARQMLERADLDEEQKQRLLVAMSCPCCGAGGLSLTVKLKR
jgi:hypothetical protein